jgi:4'-phosphopantetheinyl transferase
MSDVALETISDDSSLVHVCTFLVSRHSRLFAEIAAYLSPEERMRAERFYREVDRRRFVLGRAMVRRLCGTHLGVEPETVRLEQTSNGKPYLGCSTEVSQRRMEFNVAHSGDCVLIAWSLGQSMGIDVEALDRDPPVLVNDVAAAAFSDAERTVLGAAAPDQIAATFYRIWVRKEAVLKAEGCGIAGRLQSFSVARRHEARTEWVDQVQYADGGRIWKIVDLAPAPGHLAALALPETAIAQIETPDRAAFTLQREN